MVSCRRNGVDYRTFAYSMDRKEVPTYGVDGPPALGVISSGGAGGFGARPDLVLSGINHGVNVGRSALHSGTIGAVLTAAEFGVRGLATSIRYGPDPVPWETAANLAESLVALLLTSPPGTALIPERPRCHSRTSERIRAVLPRARGTIRSVTTTFRTTTKVPTKKGNFPPSTKAGNTHGLCRQDLAEPCASIWRFPDLPGGSTG